MREIANLICTGSDQSLCLNSTPWAGRHTVRYLKRMKCLLIIFSTYNFKGFVYTPQLMLARYITQFIRTFDMSWIYQVLQMQYFSKKEFIDDAKKLS